MNDSARKPLPVRIFNVLSGFGLATILLVILLAETWLATLERARCALVARWYTTHPLSGLSSGSKSPAPQTPPACLEPGPPPSVTKRASDPSIFIRTILLGESRPLLNRKTRYFPSAETLTSETNLGFSIPKSRFKSRVRFSIPVPSGRTR